jgi:hypothetical protein
MRFQFFLQVLMLIKNTRAYQETVNKDFLNINPIHLLGLMNGQMEIGVFLDHYPHIKKYVQAIFSSKGLFSSFFQFFQAEENLGYLISPQYFSEYLALMDSNILLIERPSQLGQWVHTCEIGQRKIAIVKNNLFFSLEGYSAIELFRHESSYSVRLYNSQNTQEKASLEAFHLPTHFYQNQKPRCSLFEEWLHHEVLSSLSFSFAIEDYLHLQNQMYWNIREFNHLENKHQVFEISERMTNPLDKLLRNQLRKFIFFQCLGLKGDSSLHYRQLIRLHHTYETHLRGDKTGTLLHFSKEYTSPILQEASDQIFSLILMESAEQFSRESPDIQKAYYQFLLHCIRYNAEHAAYQMAVVGLGVQVTEKFLPESVKKVVWNQLKEWNPNPIVGLGFQ